MCIQIKDDDTDYTINLVEYYCIQKQALIQRKLLYIQSGWRSTDYGIKDATALCWLASGPAILWQVCNHITLYHDGIAYQYICIVKISPSGFKYD